MVSYRPVNDDAFEIVLHTKGVASRGVEALDQLLTCIRETDDCTMLTLREAESLLAAFQDAVGHFRK